MDLSEIFMFAFYAKNLINRDLSTISVKESQIESFTTAECGY